MRRTGRAIRILLSAASLLFLLLMIGLGVFSMQRLQRRATASRTRYAINGSRTFA